MKKGIITKSAFKKLSSGHPWLSASDIVDRKILPPRAGAFLLGQHWWLYSPESFLKLRRLGPSLAGWMYTPRFNTLSNADQFQSYFGNWLLCHFKETLQKKMKLQNLDEEDLCLRWIFSENDFVPGLIVDIFGDKVVAQINTAPIELFWVNIQKILARAYHEVVGKEPTIKELRNSSVRKKEGLEIIVPETEPEPMILRWNGLIWQMSPGGSQKTGSYFDQRENHNRTKQIALERKYKTAWDLCAYQGGFGLHLAKAGVKVTAVDQSETALEAANKNLSLNSIPEENFVTQKADVFTWLRHKVESKSKVDLIILDPPSFVKSRTEINAATRGYKELNALALQCLNPGGLLVTCVCSHHLTPKLFESVLKDAAAIAKTKVKVLERHGPSPDHAPAPHFTEGNYLQAYYLVTS
ncbi:MAG: class I SAM-dependent rRNA methyltransferase [Bdellovibrionales bacterium]|nr:class I SAM-dependent rRNA methyltransferase [Bdellovibrionales bacterium]